MMDLQDHPVASASFSGEMETRLREAFERNEQRQEDDDPLTHALNAMCTEARYRKMTPAAIVIAMRRTWALIPRPAGVTPREWSHEYYAALGRCISTYFGEKA